jgi:hypothetical protein
VPGASVGESVEGSSVLGASVEESSVPGSSVVGMSSCQRWTMLPRLLGV